MKIAKIETFTTELIGFVRVTTDSGEQGWGQVSTYNADITCEVLHRQVAPHALGADALDFADLIDLIGERGQGCSTDRVPVQRGVERGHVEAVKQGHHRVPQVVVGEDPVQQQDRWGRGLGAKVVDDERGHQNLRVGM